MRSCYSISIKILFYCGIRFVKIVIDENMFQNKKKLSLREEINREVFFLFFYFFFFFFVHCRCEEGAEKIGNGSRRSNNADARTHGNDDGQTRSTSLHATETFRWINKIIPAALSDRWRTMNWNVVIRSFDY